MRKMSPSKLQPGQEVTLTSGTPGVLFARTWDIRKRTAHSDAPTWYFLPDNAGSVGLVVMSQPHEIAETEIALAHGLRPGRWPSPTHWLRDHERHAAYAAHMRKAPLPETGD
jgi:hypothetical protein